MAKSAAEVMVEALAASGVKRIYGLPGDSLNGLTDAIRKNSKIEWVHVRHEEVAAFAAGAEAHLTGDLVVCAGSCGPGNMHLINGLYDCHRSRVPVLAIAAQIPSEELGTGYFQETHPEILFKDCSHYCELVSDAEHVPRILGIAMRTAISKRGVAVVVAPGDVMLGDCSETVHGLDAVRLCDAGSVFHPCEGDLQAAAEILNKADKVTILGGIGCMGAHAELMEIAGALKAPIVHALRGKEFIEYDNPYDVGLTGLIGFASGYHAMMNCDALLMLGTDFPYTQFFPEKAKIIQVDIRGEQIGRRTHVDLGLVGTVRDTVRALLPKLKKKKNSKHLDVSVKHYADSRKELDEMAAGEPGKTPIHPQYVARLLNELAAEDAVFTCDVGLPTVWASRYLKMNGKRSLLGSFVHGSMASAMPQGIGAQAAFPGRQVIALAGDGGLAMLMGDLLTLKQMKLPLKVVVFNNSALGFVELEMKAAGFLDYGTALENPSFAEVGTACGMLGLRVEQPEDLRPALERALAYDGPALVDVVVNRQELSLPPNIQLKQATGFGLYAMKAVMSGRGGEVVDLAKTNIFR